MGNPIKPSHYKLKSKDLIAQWMERGTPDQVRFAMYTHIDKYIFRDKDDRIQDFHKARYFLERLIEYEKDLKNKSQE